MRFSIYSLLLLTFLGCTSNDNSVSQSSLDVPVTIPKELIRFEAVGDNLLSRIGYYSIVLNDGSILIPDRHHLKLFRVDSSGELIEIIGRKGHGPGEFQDITFLSHSAFGNILIYDQLAQKVVVLDSQGDYYTEILIPSDKPSGTLSEIYEVEEQQYLMIFQSTQFVFNKDSEQISYLVTYNRDQDRFSSASTINSRPNALKARGWAWKRVPYAAADLIAYDKTTANFFIYRSDGHEIAKLDTSRDTLQVISFYLEPEIMTRAEADTLRSENQDYWGSMQNLLPEYKAIADQLMIDYKNNFWLKLNHSSEYQQWLTLSEQGQHLQVIQLPKNSMLTHLSEEHLGVRLDDITFALFEFPEI